jgi:hypothetical protein
MLLVYERAKTTTDKTAQRTQHASKSRTTSALRGQCKLLFTACSAALPVLTLVLLSLNSARRPLLTQLAM